jgi:copper transport protein
LSQRPGRGAAAALLLLAGLTLFPAALAAHQRLLGTSPVRDSTVDTAPGELRLVFYEPAQVTFTTIRLIGPDGRPVALGDVRTSGDSANVVLVPVTGHLMPGEYLVQWATASRDGHPVQGDFRFTIADDAAGLDAHMDHPAGEFAGGVTAPGQAAPAAVHHAAPSGPGRFQADAPAYVAVRWLTYVGILGVIGTAVFRFLILGLLRRRLALEDQHWLHHASRRAASFGVLFAVLTLLAGAGRLYAQSMAMHGAEHALDAGRLLMMLQRTVWGWGWLIHMAGTCLALAGFALAGRSPERTWAWVLAASGALALAVTPALSGHAAAMTGTAGTLAIVMHTLHVIGAAGWLGSLLVLMLAGVPAALAAGGERRGELVAQLVRAFSPAALMFAGLLIASGIVAAVLHSSSLAALLGSRYGNLLFVKLGIFLLVFATGAYNFLRVQPSLGGAASVRHLKRSAAVELAIAAAVLLVTAVLVATARPYEEAEQLVAGDVHTITTAAPTAGSLQ